VAKAFLSKSFIEIAKKKVHFSKYPPADSGLCKSASDVSLPSDHEEDDMEEETPNDPALARTIHIADVPADLLDVLEVFLENPKKGGGPIEIFNTDAQDEVVVTFEDLEGFHLNTT